MEIMRSLLFVPGNRRDMQEKAVSFTADILVPDMEDSVPVGEKSAARNVISDMLPVLAQAGHRLVVRVNALDTGWLEEDLAAAVSPHTYGVNVGKVENAWDVQEVDKIIAGVEAKAGLDRGHIRLVLFLESALAMVNAYSICAASPRVVAVAFGAEDYTVDMEVKRTPEGDEVYMPRAMVAIAAKAGGRCSLGHRLRQLPG